MNIKESNRRGLEMTTEERRRYDALWKQRKYAESRRELFDLLGNKCENCGFSDVRALCVDHRYGGGTVERKLSGGNYMMKLAKKVREGSTEYQLLCCNCNQIKKTQSEERPSIYNTSRVRETVISLRS